MTLSKYADFIREGLKTPRVPGLIHQAISRESKNDQALREVEYTFFARISDYEQLNRAESSELQEQWSYLLRSADMECKARVRKVEREEETHYYYTNKLKIWDEDGQWELEQEIDQGHYNLLKRYCKNGMKKRRFFFPMSDQELTWEVDVFYDQEGQFIPWVKIDLEVTHRLDKIPDFPIEAEEVILNQHGERTDGENRLIRRLFENDYQIKA